jgi:hypothetical protein
VRIYFPALAVHFQIIMKERPTKPYIYNISLATTCFGAAGAPSSGSPKYPDEIVHTLCHNCQISEGRNWISSVCCQLKEPYDVTYTQFHQDSLGSLKMALLQRRNM